MGEHRAGGSAAGVDGGSPMSPEPPTVRQQGSDSGADRLCLVVNDGSTARRYPLVTAGPLGVGRGAECDVVIRSPLVSRKHAIIHVGEFVAIEDLGSTNGTTVGAARVPARTPIRLDPGAVASVGPASLIVVRETPSATPGPAGSASSASG